MKKIIALLLAIMMLCGITAFAEEAAVDEADRNYAPESGTGWMSVDIHGEHEELTYVESVRSLSGTTYIFENDDYRVSIVFDRDLEVGVTMGENSINSIEVQSHVTATSGYYFTRSPAMLLSTAKSPWRRSTRTASGRAPSASPC